MQWAETDGSPDYINYCLTLGPWPMRSFLYDQIATLRQRAHAILAPFQNWLARPVHRFSRHPFDCYRNAKGWHHHYSSRPLLNPPVGFVLVRASFHKRPIG